MKSFNDSMRRWEEDFRKRRPELAELLPDHFDKLCIEAFGDVPRSPAEAYAAEEALDKEHGRRAE